MTSGKLLFGGSRMEAMISGTAVTSNEPAFFDTAFCDAAINVVHGSAEGVFYDPAAAPLLTQYAVGAGHSLFFHFRFAWGTNFNGYTGTYPAVILYDSTGSPWIMLKTTGEVQYNSVSHEQLAYDLFVTSGGPGGSAGSPADFVYTGPSMTGVPATLANAVWTTLGNIGYIGNELIDSGIPSAHDIRVDIDGAGNHSITVYRDESLTGGLVKTDFTQTLMTDLSSFSIAGDYFSGSPQAYSEIIATEDLVTLYGRVNTLRGASAGTYQEWAGTVSDINEVVPDDTTANLAATAGLRQTYHMTVGSVPENTTVAGVFNWLRARSNGGSPANLKSKLIVAGTEYDSANLSDLDIAFASVGARYDTNPATGTAWTQADINAPLELGFVSEA